MQKSKVRPKHFSEQKSSWVWCIGWIATQPKTIFCGHKKLYATMEKVHWKARRLWWQIKPFVIFYICWNAKFTAVLQSFILMQPRTKQILAAWLKDRKEKNANLFDFQLFSFSNSRSLQLPALGFQVLLSAPCSSDAGSPLRHSPSGSLAATLPLSCVRRTSYLRK